jgi:nucleoside 2-deoxyribosyltransferase
MNLERKTQHLGQAIPLREDNCPTLFPHNTDEITFTLRQLADAGYLTGYHATFPCSVVLSGKGLMRVADLQRGVFGPLNKQVFVAMSFDKSLDTVYADGLKLAIEDCDYKALRVDAKEHNEKICDMIVAEIRNSKFLVADFTMHRGGVYFEAGLMMGLGRPVIFTCRNDEIGKAHFDTRQYNHIVWDTPADLSEKLKRRIQATIAPRTLFL